MHVPELDRGGERTAHDWFMQGARQPVPLQDAAFWPYGEGFNVAHFQLGSGVLQLLLDTSDFLQRALSYRGFKVAAGAWCLAADGRRGRALGYNVKVDNSSAVNIHAEDLVTAKARDGDFNEFSVLAVIGQPQMDHASGKLMDTLHPCGRCRYNLEQSGLVTERTLLVMARPDFTVIQLGSLAAVQVAHESGDDSGIATFTYPETPAILEPRPWDVWLRQPAVRVEEIDSTDFDSTVGAYLWKRYAQAG